MCVFCLVLFCLSVCTIAQVLSSPTFRCFTSKDVVGVEVGGAVKNVIALAAGMCEGLGLGKRAKNYLAFALFSIRVQQNRGG